MQVQNHIPPKWITGQSTRYRFFVTRGSCVIYDKQTQEMQLESAAETEDYKFSIMSLTIL